MGFYYCGRVKWRYFRMSPAQIFSEMSPFKRWCTIMGAVSATLGTFVVVMNAAGIAEPHWIATRGYTRLLVEKVEASATQRSQRNLYELISVKIAIQETARNAVQAQIDRLEVELKKLPNTASQSLRALMDEQIRNYKNQLRQLDIQLEDLRRQRRAGEQ